MTLWGEVAQQQCERIKLLPLHRGRVCSRRGKAGAGTEATTVRISREG